MNEVMWRPSPERMKSSTMNSFMQFVEQQTSLSFNMDPVAFHQFSVSQSELFWKLLIDYLPFQIVGHTEPACLDHKFDQYGWFPGLSLNFAKNLLANGEDDAIALVSLHESLPKRELTFKGLRDQVGRLMEVFSHTLKAGDVVGAYMPNIQETVVAMLATSGLGAQFTSTSRDFGAPGVIDRFGQSNPRILFSVSSYMYNGKLIDMRAKLKEVMNKLPGIEQVVIVNFTGDDFDLSEIPRSITFDEYIKKSELTPPSFEDFPFDSALYIMYSSGTTGKPKCIVHSAGGTLLAHAKELCLHSDLKAQDRILYFTTCGWMMWNWLVSSLFTGTTTYLYEGSPGYPDLTSFMSKIDQEQITHFGTSPKFLKALEESGYHMDHPLVHLKTLLSTGSPLLPEQFDFIYQDLKADLQVASICGGTDIVGCFMLGHPLRPVYRSEIQSLGLGLDVAAFSEQGERLFEKEGELVCTASFPNRPLGLLGDDDGSRMKTAYFDHFPDVWHHGDFVTLTKEGGVIVYGRSDATLNPGGVRIGTSEIYRQTESLSYIEDSLCVGREKEGDVDVMLYVLMKGTEKLTPERILEIKSLIKKNTTPRHVPKEVLAVSGIPYTRSGKKMELAVSRLINGRELTNIEAVANPECLDQYRI